MFFNYTVQSDIGKKRNRNQDRAWGDPDLGLFLVADGMGGHQGGETASQLSIDLIPEELKHQMPSPNNSNKKHPKEALAGAIQKANHSILEKAQKQPDLYGMGTTLTALWFFDQRLFIAQIGDSRCYFLNGEGIWQLTDDHSLVEEKIKAGVLTRSEAEEDEGKHVLTRCLGYEPDPDIDFYTREIQPRELYLICSDGLSGPLDPHKINEIVQKNFFYTGDLAGTAQQLVQLANERAGDDNITVLLTQPVVR